MFVVLLGINHKTAPVEIRETLAMSKPQIKNHQEQLAKLSGSNGLIILSTCNRTEFYMATKTLEQGKKSLLNFVAMYRS